MSLYFCEISRQQTVNRECKGTASSQAGLLAERPPRQNADLRHHELLMDGMEEKGLVCRGMNSLNYSPIFVLPVLHCVDIPSRCRIGSVLLRGARDYTQVPPLPIAYSNCVRERVLDVYVLTMEQVLAAIHCSNQV